MAARERRERNKCQERFHREDSGVFSPPRLGKIVDARWANGHNEILSADTNLFLYAANPDSPHHDAAQRFFEEEASGKQRFLFCGLVLVELYMQFRNPAVFKKPKTAKEATAFSDALRALTLRHHGVTHFATANAERFAGFGFEWVWRPMEL